jgi:hypothetical protein
MGADGTPQRIRRTDRPAARDPGRNLAVLNVLCLAILAVVVGWGWVVLREQIATRNELVRELRQELSSLRDDVAQIDRKTSDLADSAREIDRRLQEDYRRIIIQQRERVATRLERLEQQLRGEQDRMRGAQAACLAEFDFYHRRNLAIPREIVAAAIERLVARRMEELAALAEDVHAHLERERTWLTELDTGRSIGLHHPDQHSPLVTPQGHEPITTGVPPAPSARGDRESAVIAEAEDAEGDDRELVIRQGTPERQGSPTDSPVVSCLPMPGAAELIPIPESQLPPTGPLAGRAPVTAPSGRTGIGILSYASGRRVEMGSAAPPTAVLRPVVILPPRPEDAPSGVDVTRQ